MVSDSFNIWRQMLQVKIILDLCKILFRSWVLACILWLLEPPRMQALANCPISWWFGYFLELCVFGASCGQLLRHLAEAYRRSRSSEDIPRNVYTLRFSCRSSHVVCCGWRGSIRFFRCRFQRNLDTWIYTQDPSCWEAAFYPYWMYKMTASSLESGSWMQLWPPFWTVWITVSYSGWQHFRLLYLHMVRTYTVWWCLVPLLLPFADVVAGCSVFLWQVCWLSIEGIRYKKQIFWCSWFLLPTCSRYIVASLSMWGI